MRKACLISALAIAAPGPKDSTNRTASSKDEYSTENSSLLMPSLMEQPRGDDKSRTNLTEPSFLGAAPKGEQCRVWKGECVKGPAVWPRDTSSMMAFVTARWFCLAERRFLGLDGRACPWKPTSKPCASPDKTKSRLLRFGCWLMRAEKKGNAIGEQTREGIGLGGRRAKSRTSDE